MSETEAAAETAAAVNKLSLEESTEENPAEGGGEGEEKKEEPLNDVSGGGMHAVRGCFMAPCERGWMAAAALLQSC